MRKEEIREESIFLIHDFFEPEDCLRSIAFSEGRGYGDAPLTTFLGPLVTKEIRNNARVMVDAPVLAGRLFERARPFLPARIDSWLVDGLNERFRYYRYDAGQRFRKHYDGSFVRSLREESHLTFLVYLNDDFDGGTTDFFADDETLRASIRPKRGTALVFAHAQLHEGAEVARGRKYVLRTDVMYRYAPAYEVARKEEVTT